MHWAIILVKPRKVFFCPTQTFVREDWQIWKPAWCITATPQDDFGSHGENRPSCIYIKENRMVGCWLSYLHANALFGSSVTKACIFWWQISTKILIIFITKTRKSPVTSADSSVKKWNQLSSCLLWSFGFEQPDTSDELKPLIHYSGIYVRRGDDSFIVGMHGKSCSAVIARIVCSLAHIFGTISKLFGNTIQLIYWCLVFVALKNNSSTLNVTCISHLRISLLDVSKYAIEKPCKPKSYSKPFPNNIDTILRTSEK